jgi:peptidoglycan/LPS O-acetylase OafA/YrhL
MTVARLVAWTLVWLAGWALFFIHPAAHSSQGSILLIGVAPLIMMTPRQWKEDAPSRGATIVLILLVSLFLLLVFLLPPSYTWQFPGDPRLVTGLKAFGLLVAGFGIGVTGRRFVQEQSGAA